MRTIIAGSRTISPTADEMDLIIAESGINVTSVLCGGARGVDKAGAEWGRGQGIAVQYFLAEWKLKGRKAGILRNVEMAKNADALIAIWDGKSRGTKHMIDTAREAGIKVMVASWDPTLGVGK
jgi:hypothetical protein